MKMAGDWIRLHRQSLDSQVFSDPVLWRVWCWCLLKANWRAGWYQGEKIEPGEFATGRTSAASELGMSESAWYRTMSKLEKIGCISLKANNRFTRVFIANWAVFQGSVNSQRTASEQPADSERTTDEQRMNNQRTTDEQPADTIEEGKEFKEGEEGKEEQEGKKGVAASGSRPRRATKPTTGEWDIPERLDTDEVRGLLDRFESMRRRKRKPILDRNDASRVLKHFDDAEHLSYALEFVISNEYQGLKPDYRPPGQASGSARGSPSRPKTFEEIKRENTDNAFEEVFGEQARNGKQSPTGSICDLRDGG